MSEKTPITPTDASRIQGSVDRNGGDAGFKSRTTSAAARNVNAGKAGSGTKGGKR
jgi:hypothetical protein